MQILNSFVLNVYTCAGNLLVDIDIDVVCMQINLPITWEGMVASLRLSMVRAGIPITWSRGYLVLLVGR